MIAAERAGGWTRTSCRGRCVTRQTERSGQHRRGGRSPTFTAWTAGRAVDRCKKCHDSLSAKRFAEATTWAGATVLVIVDMSVGPNRIVRNESR